ncbi:probable aminotransferase TAT2 [Momordica charantia]|uniref:Probable aminotransferase TAT2 n=1 Tax=Momordica charantia TaxID=3673 RepID=A0A6J1CDM8_MOMCH|nr:probable aminotransferase TAT2 [Momordica charantia]
MMEIGAVNSDMDTASTITIKGILSLLLQNVDENDAKRLISLGMGDPSAYSAFHTTHVAEQAVVDSLQSEKFNGYAPTAGLPQARRSIAEYLSRDLPYKLTSDDVFITSGCTQAIDVALAMLARPGANILLPRPGFPIYELCSAFRNLEVRHFDLLPQRAWEVDLDAVETLADQNTVALVIINPGNPCGNVYSYQHLKKIAETAEKLGILVIADEVYGHLAFGSKPFVPMGVFGSTVPVLTLGSLSKRWIVPGWRLGWFVTSDPSGTFRKPKVLERIKKYFDILGGPATFIQAAVPQILESTDEVFFKKTINLLKQTSEICCRKIQEIPCITCTHKPEGSMAVMVRLNMDLLEDVSDDIDFCFKLAKEESLIILPGTAVGLKNWLRITFAVDPSFLEEGLERLKCFCQRHTVEL